MSVGLILGMWKRLTASNLEDGVGTSICTVKWKRKRKRKRWKRHENRPLPHPYLQQLFNGKTNCERVKLWSRWTDKLTVRRKDGPRKDMILEDHWIIYLFDKDCLRAVKDPACFRLFSPLSFFDTAWISRLPVQLLTDLSIFLFSGKFLLSISLSVSGFNSYFSFSIVNTSIQLGVMG